MVFFLINKQQQNLTEKSWKEYDNTARLDMDIYTFINVTQVTYALKHRKNRARYGCHFYLLLFL